MWLQSLYRTQVKELKDDVEEKAKQHQDALLDVDSLDKEKWVVSTICSIYTSLPVYS